VSEAQEAKRLRDENSRLRKLVADLSLDKEALQSVIEEIYGPPLDCKHDVDGGNESAQIYSVYLWAVP